MFVRGFLKNLIFLVAVGVAVYFFRAPLGVYFLPAWDEFQIRVFSKAPCKEPIPYILGTFATEFNISQKYFLDALTEAEAVWEKPYGKDLFTYEPDNKSRTTLKVNLIYDCRQQATTKLKSLGIVVEENRTSYDSLRVRFEILKTEYEQEKKIFNMQIENFNRKNKEYEARVEYWNSRGGAPEKEFNELRAESRALEAESKVLQKMQNNLNNKADEINALVVAINRLAGILNLSVEKYNTTNTARGESFEEGVYSSDGLSREIDVYEFSNRDKLIRVLAHELGHALGLSHVDDPKAIMYELNQGNNMALTRADLEALETRCAE